MLEEIEDQLKDNEIVMVVVPNIDYSKKLMDVLKIVVRQNKSVCYVSVNRPVSSLVKLFNASGVETKKIQIVDCITESIKEEEKVDGLAVFIKSPRNLTKLSIVLTEAIKKGAEAIFVDALSTFLIYEENLAVIRFAHDLITKIRSFNRKGVFLVLKNDISNVLLTDLSMFVDKVIEMS